MKKTIVWTFGALIVLFAVLSMFALDMKNKAMANETEYPGNESASDNLTYGTDSKPEDVDELSVGTAEKDHAEPGDTVYNDTDSKNSKINASKTENDKKQLNQTTENATSEETKKKTGGGKSGATNQAVISNETKKNVSPDTSSLPYFTNDSTFSNLSPIDGAVLVPLHADMSLLINATSPFSVKFSLYDSSGLLTEQKRDNLKSGTQAFDGNDFVTKKAENYRWIVNITTANGSFAREFRFTTGLSSQIKFQTTLGDPELAQIFPVMGDIDNDGTQEIVMAVGSRILSVNGKTGQIEWTQTGSAKTAVELIDLNSDGVPEVVFGTSSKRLRALKGDGSVMWTSDILNGSIQAEFPIVSGDVNADGYPEIFFASGDVTPSPYSGNDSEYTGAMTKLDHNGKVLDTVWIHHPCWGGLSLADYNFDGKFEVYMGDRRAGYLGFPAKGLQAFDADTLDMLWSRPELQHSSPMAILDNVLDDGNLEVIGEPITIKGPIIIDPATGANIVDYSMLKLPTHATATTYDIDGDSRLEMFFGTSYPENAPMNIVVFDLFNGAIDFQQNFSFPTTWPPTAAEVTGDGKLDIIAPMGFQDNNTTDFPLIIFNDKFVKVEEKMIPNSGQLMPAVVGDSDGDGKNEIIVAGFKGMLTVLDTDADQPNPAPRTWVQRYSEYRRGAAEYVEAPGPKAPMILNETPLSASENVSSNAVLSARVFDYQQEKMSIKFEINSGSGWKTMKEYSGAGNGVYNANASGFITSASRSYQWKISATDISGNKNEKTFYFTTAGYSGNESNQTDNSTNTTKGSVQLVISRDKVTGNLTNFPVLVDLTSADFLSKINSGASNIYFTAENGAKLSHEVESYDSATGHLVAWVKIPLLTSMKDTLIYLNYGGAASLNPEDVWDSAYLAVHHFEEKNGSITDSTSKGNDGVAENGVVLGVAGKIGGADRFDGVDDRIRLPKVFTSQTKYTIEGWMYFDGTKQGYMVSQRNLSLKGVFVQYYPPEGNFQVYQNPDSIRINATPAAWHYVVATYDGQTAKLYVDGANAVSLNSAPPTWPVESMYIGDRATGSRALKGILDEIRISDVARSDEYVKTSYANQNAPQTFVRIAG